MLAVGPTATSTPMCMCKQTPDRASSEESGGLCHLQPPSPTLEPGTVHAGNIIAQQLLLLLLLARLRHSQSPRTLAAFRVPPSKLILPQLPFCCCSSSGSFVQPCRQNSIAALYCSFFLAEAVICLAVERERSS